MAVDLCQLGAVFLSLNTSTEVNPTPTHPHISGYQAEEKLLTGDNLQLQCSAGNSSLPSLPRLFFSCGSRAVRVGQERTAADASGRSLLIHIDHLQLQDDGVVCVCSGVWTVTQPDYQAVLRLESSVSLRVEGPAEVNTAMLAGVLSGLVFLVALVVIGLACWRTGSTRGTNTHPPRQINDSNSVTAIGDTSATGPRQPLERPSGQYNRPESTPETAAEHGRQSHSSSSGNTLHVVNESSAERSPRSTGNSGAWQGVSQSTPWFEQLNGRPQHHLLYVNQSESAAGRDKDTVQPVASAVDGSPELLLVATKNTGFPCDDDGYLTPFHQPPRPAPVDDHNSQAPKDAKFTRGLIRSPDSKHGTYLTPVQYMGKTTSPNTDCDTRNHAWAFNSRGTGAAETQREESATTDTRLAPIFRHRRRRFTRMKRNSGEMRYFQPVKKGVSGLPGFGLIPHRVYDGSKIGDSIKTDDVNKMGYVRKMGSKGDE